MWGRAGLRQHYGYVRIGDVGGIKAIVNSPQLCQNTPHIPPPSPSPPLMPHLGVADQHQALLVLPQVLLEPHTCLEIKMVGLQGSGGRFRVQGRLMAITILPCITNPAESRSPSSHPIHRPNVCRCCFFLLLRAEAAIATWAPQTGRMRHPPDMVSPVFPPHTYTHRLV